MMLVPYDESNLDILKQLATDALKQNDILKYNQILQKIKLHKKSNSVMQTNKSSTTDKTTQTEVLKQNIDQPDLTNKATSTEVQTDTSDNEYVDEQMDMSIMPYYQEENQIMEKQQQKILELENKIKSYKSLLRERIQNPGVRSIRTQTDDFTQDNNKKRKRKDSDVDPSPRVSTDRQDKFEKLYRQHIHQPKTSYSFSADIPGSLEAVNEDYREVSKIVQDPKDQNKRSSRNTFMQWTKY